jgi:Uma2 family endonuclease
MSVAMEDWPRQHRITVDEYLRMAESGSIAPDARVELIDGVIIDMPPIGSAHAAVVRQLNVLLQQAVGDRATVDCQLPVRLGNNSMPQPDFALLLPRKDFYKEQHPSAADTLLTIEVSDTTLINDLRRKMELYSRHDIKEYWVVDVVNRRLHAFRDLVGGCYERASCLDRPGSMDITALPGTSVDLSTLFTTS